VPAAAASHDNNIEWDGVSHVAWLDRNPLCPVDGETFQVLFQTYADDLTSARVRVDDGTAAWTVASKTAVRGPYDIWSATVPATASTGLSYYMELTDGTATDYLSVEGMSAGTPADGGFPVDYVTLEHAPVGATPLPDGGAVFRVWSPTRTIAHVRGEFNGWGTGDPMTKMGEHFIVRVPEATSTTSRTRTGTPTRAPVPWTPATTTTRICWTHPPTTGRSTTSTCPTSNR